LVLFEAEEQAKFPEGVNVIVCDAGVFSYPRQNIICELFWKNLVRGSEFSIVVCKKLFMRKVSNEPSAQKPHGSGSAHQNQGSGSPEQN